MGPRLFPSVSVKNAIQYLVDSDTIDGDLAVSWKLGLEVLEMKKKANNGDTEAMVELGCWYKLGGRGLAKNDEEAYKWVRKADAFSDRVGMTCQADALACGVGVAQNTSLALVLFTRAAEMGSLAASVELGNHFFEGSFGLPEDHVEAKRWYQKAIDDSKKESHRDVECVSRKC